jgi:methionine-gamma-lyase
MRLNPIPKLYIPKVLPIRYCKFQIFRSWQKLQTSAGAKLMVDNTFTPMIFTPAMLGADLVVYSMTKFINGKNDCVAGAICGSAEFVNQLSNVNNGTAMLLGPVLDPLRSSSILKNLNTLHIRMKQHSKNAQYLAENFEKMGLKIIYPGLPKHPQYELHKTMMNTEYGFGGMLAIDFGTMENAYIVMQKMQDVDVGYLAVSLGYFKTLFSCSGHSTSSEIPAEVQKEMGLSEGLVRFSVGLDNDIDARNGKRLFWRRLLVNCFNNFRCLYFEYIFLYPPLIQIPEIIIFASTSFIATKTPKHEKFRKRY